MCRRTNPVPFEGPEKRHCPLVKTNSRKRKKRWSRRKKQHSVAVDPMTRTVKRLKIIYKDGSTYTQRGVYSITTNDKFLHICDQYGTPFAIINWDSVALVKHV